jgi:hypothetical protein
MNILTNSKTFIMYLKDIDDISLSASGNIKAVAKQIYGAYLLKSSVLCDNSG